MPNQNTTEAECRKIFQFYASYSSILERVSGRILQACDQLLTSLQSTQTRRDAEELMKQSADQVEKALKIVRLRAELLFAASVDVTINVAEPPTSLDNDHEFCRHQARFDVVVQTYWSVQTEEVLGLVRALTAGTARIAELADLVTKLRQMQRDAAELAEWFRSRYLL